MNNSKIKELEGSSNNEINGIVNYKPHWVVRNGGYFFIIIISLLFLLFKIISYPEIVKAQGKLFIIKEQMIGHNFFYVELDAKSEDMDRISKSQTIVLEPEGCTTCIYEKISGKIITVEKISDRNFFLIKAKLFENLTNKKEYVRVLSYNGLLAKAKIFVGQRTLLNKLLKSLKLS